MATVAVGDLSLPDRRGEPGQRRPLLHPGRARQGAGASPAGRSARPRPHRRTSELPTIKEVDDPVLARIWSIRRSAARRSTAAWAMSAMSSRPRGGAGCSSTASSPGYGPEPWLVGQYFPLEDATSDLDRLTNGAIVGGRHARGRGPAGAADRAVSMARSIRTITSAAEAIERLEFDQPFHRSSRLREIDDAGHSLDKARGALKWFGAYVPHRLVFRLMELGEDAVRSRRRNVTVMFSDIVEFTPQAEDLPEQQTADLLNHHFALLGACIDHEHGVIDKYIGDSVMAVWGGLSRMEDHADHAVRAALAIARVIARGQCGAPRRRPAADPRAHRPAFRPGRGRQYRRAGPGELHRGRRHREHRPALRAARQGVHDAMTRRSSCWRAATRWPRCKDRQALGLDPSSQSCAKSRATTSRSRSIVWRDVLDGAASSTASVRRRHRALNKGEL